MLVLMFCCAGELCHLMKNLAVALGFKVLLLCLITEVMGILFIIVHLSVFAHNGAASCCCALSHG